MIYRLAIQLFILLCEWHTDVKVFAYAKSNKLLSSVFGMRFRRVSMAYRGSSTSAGLLLANFLMFQLGPPFLSSLLVTYV